MPIQGFTRARKHQFGRQGAMGTPVAATRAYPKNGVPSVNLTWTDPDVDTGSIVKTVAPSRGAGDYTAPLTDPALAYNNIPLLGAGVFGGQIGPTNVGGTGRRWTFKPAAVSPLDDPDVFTYEFGDDVEEDWFQLGDGLIETLTITMPEGLGPWTVSDTWRFGSAASTGSTDSPVSGTVPTPSLDVDTDPTYVYLKDTGLFIADDVAGLGAGQVLNALHSGTLTINRLIDQKRFANATQTFDINDYGVTGYEVSLALVLAKTDDTVGTGSEADAWFSDDAVARVIRLTSTSTRNAGTATPYSSRITLPAWYYTREDGEQGGNSTVTLTANAYFEPDDFDGFFEWVAVTTLSEAELGAVAS